MVLSFKEFLTEEDNSKLRDWIINKFETTNKSYDEIRTDFGRKFGRNKLKYFDRIVKEYDA